MKPSVNSKIIVLITLGILFAFSPIITSNFIFNVRNNKTSSEYSADNNLDKENLKISAISGKIHIINNSGWVAFKNAENCTGNGTYFDPYVIEDLVIDGEGSGSCIWIENSDIYFKIENCKFYNSGGLTTAGIRLDNTNNGFLIDNDCSSINGGIMLINSDNNTISGNTAINNEGIGIYLFVCNNNTISGNTANNNDNNGIFLVYSHHNFILGNTGNYNHKNGVFLRGSDHNTISGNTANNNFMYNGICLTSDSNFNIVSGNTVNDNFRIGLSLEFSPSNYILENTANNNYRIGIYLYRSNYSTISGNTANNNGEAGISLKLSSYNLISKNTLLGNGECILEVDCEGNNFENNNCGIIPGYNLFFLLGTLSFVIIFINKKLKKS